jgi:hypothetical protein
MFRPATPVDFQNSPLTAVTVPSRSRVRPLQPPQPPTKSATPPQFNPHAPLPIRLLVHVFRPASDRLTTSAALVFLRLFGAALRVSHGASSAGK